MAEEYNGEWGPLTTDANYDDYANQAGAYAPDTSYGGEWGPLQGTSGYSEWSNPVANQSSTSAWDDVGKKLIEGLLQPDALKTVFGTAVGASFTGIASWLNTRATNKSREDAAKYSADRVDQTIRDKVTRASAMPKLKPLTKNIQGKKVGEGWKAPGLIASARK